MLTNVNSYFALGVYGVLNVISWKYTFKRLNEEYEIAQKKKQALDNLFVVGKISQDTRDSFTGDITAAIAEIEKQKQDLVEKMQAKTRELESQLKTLENLLANYEIQHVVGEIDDEIYTREINLLSTTLETTRNELDVIKQATDQLFTPAQPIQTSAAPELVVPTTTIEIEQPTPVETIPVETPVDAAPNETTIVEPASAETPPIEVAPMEAPIEVLAEPAPVEAPATESPVEASITEAAPTEAVADTPEIVQIENTPAETAPDEVAPIETTPVKTSPIEVETPPIETPITESPPAEPSPIEEALKEAPAIITTEPEAQIITEPVITEAAVQEPIIDMEEAASVDQPTIEAPTDNAAPVEIIAEVAQEQPAVEVPLQVFEVTEQQPVETTLEKVMEPVIEAITEPTMVEEAQVPAHPSEAPHQAPSEVITEADSDQTPPAEESEENTTE